MKVVEPFHPLMPCVLRLVRLISFVLWTLSILICLDWLANEPGSRDAVLELLAALASLLGLLTDKLQGGAP